MTSPINLSTGPVAVSAGVINALAADPVSHRSEAFRQVFEKTTGLLCSAFNVQDCFLLTGSGTMANECMLQEIKQLGRKGLILSNGEFGSRLMQQAQCNNICFLPYQLKWGETFDLTEIAGLLRNHSLQWMLFCHCETSTGIINDLEKLAQLSNQNKALCFVDCMSTAGTMPLNLSAVSMATASSGKGLASVPGLAVVFSNITVSTKTSCPVYLDLAHYVRCKGIPFTLSSNLLYALLAGIKGKLTSKQFDISRVLAEKIYRFLNERELIPFGTKDSRVFTLVPRNEQDVFFLHLLKQHFTLSSESDYLSERGWMQLAIFGYYTETQVREIEKVIEKAMAAAYIERLAFADET